MSAPRPRHRFPTATYHPTTRAARRRRRSVCPLVALAASLLAGGALLLARPALDVGASEGPPADREVVAAADQFGDPAPEPTVAAASPSASPDPVEAAPVLRLPGPVPSAGQGSFRYDDRAGEVLGRAGTLQHYRVAVEEGSEEDVHAFGTAVEEALAGPGSWVDSGRLRLQRVPGDARYDFTVYLATARTAGRMCAAGGVDIRVGGRPYTSCRAPGKVIINLDRWRASVPHYVSAKVPLAVYRMYVVNHEVGHQLGHRHERCPKRGRPAPVMMQQTLFLNGCVANPWPYLDGRRYAGPPL
ncbi:DUF3152 domain-containing protein [Micromonospora olivasterospora]|uniref:Uncharacterized protein DUF3152 n=1 Tax=Micromonospora olivasterospora TaxID=1880 RepID=A0A562I795_MICOL|nr:DUF3152 domain-containing protein [Micromonospora olivasterospora]TWH66696.1 uncharacterized protein DUF3152 [Micromonospora olivasterospora]